MKKVMFISILLISILFVSSCELFVPGGRSPQFSEGMDLPLMLPVPRDHLKVFNRLDCSEVAPPYGGGCTSGVSGGSASITCDEGTPYCSSGNICTIPDYMCSYLEDETDCHCQDEPPEPFCGDGLINLPGELCDCGGNGCIPQELAYQTCGNLGFAGGMLDCYDSGHASECQFDTSGCYNCNADGCNGNCPEGCTVADDPDCACLDNNGCCAPECDNSNDNDCSPDCVPDGCNGNCPNGCTVSDDGDCGCLSFNGCCGLGCDASNDADCIVCGDGVCDVEENCPPDKVDCLDRQCYEPTCNNGCGEIAVTNYGTDEACSGSNHCDGNGNCLANAPFCNDGTCQPFENPNNCIADCPCSSYSCQGHPWWPQCGDFSACYCGNCHWAGGGGGIPPIWVCDCLTS